MIDSDRIGHAKPLVGRMISLENSPTFPDRSLVLAHDRRGRDRYLRVVPAIAQANRHDVDTRIRIGDERQAGEVLMDDAFAGSDPFFGRVISSMKLQDLPFAVVARL